MELCKIHDWYFKEGSPIQSETGEVSADFFEVILLCRICKAELTGCLTRTGWLEANDETQ